MFENKNGLIYEITKTQSSIIKNLIGNEYKTEEIFDEEGNIIETIKYKFNLEKGEYEVIQEGAS